MAGVPCEGWIDGAAYDCRMPSISPVAFAHLRAAPQAERVVAELGDPNLERQQQVSRDNVIDVGPTPALTSSPGSRESRHAHRSSMASTMPQSSGEEPTVQSGVEQ